MCYAAGFHAVYILVRILYKKLTMHNIDVKMDNSDILQWEQEVEQKPLYRDMSGKLGIVPEYLNKAHTLGEG